MKYVLLAVTIVTLAACKDEQTVAKTISSDTEGDYRIECIGGIEYYTLALWREGYMAVRVDPETMTFVKC